MIVEHPAPFGPRWKGRWIWFEQPSISMETMTRPVRDLDGDRIGLFRRTVELDDVPATAPLRIWSDGRHLVRVNGELVVRGPVRANPRRARYDVVDLAPHLRPGPNVISIVARHFARATSWWMPVPPTYTLGAGSLVVETLLGDEWVVSDDSWRCRPGEAWTPVAAPGDVAALPMESFDAAAHPHGWEQPDFDDGDWRPARMLATVHIGASGDPHPPSEPFGMLLPPVRPDAGATPGLRHEATLTARRAGPGAPLGDDPVHQVLADEAAVGGADGNRAATGGEDDPSGGDTGPDSSSGDGAADATVADAGTGETAPADEASDDQAGDSEAAAGGAPARGTISDGAGVEVLSFDLGRIAAGTVQLTVQGAAAGTIVDLAAAEHLDGDGRLAPLGQHAGLRYRCRGSRSDGPGRDDEVEAFESLDVIGTRHLHVSVRSPGGGAPEVTVAVQERLRPRPEGTSFECSDPLLNEIFAVGLRTVDLCALDAYVDCPTREQRAWTGDAVVHQMVDLATNPDRSMARWHPQLTAVSRADGMVPMAVTSDFEADDRSMIPDWSLHWVRSVRNLWEYEGDRDLVAELLPVVERTLRWFEPYLRPDGLLDSVTGWVLLDWASVYENGCSSTLNALWARALDDCAVLADAVGNAGTAAWARERYEGVRRGFDRFWDEDRGVYVDHEVDGELRRTAAQHPGAAALAAGLVPADRIERVVAVLTDRSRLVQHSFVMDTATVEGGNTGHMYLAIGFPEPTWDVETRMVACEPFFRYVLHDGLARAGRADLIVDQVRDWRQFLDRGETSWPEDWNGGTRCHGWSSTPTRDLIVRTLGITPAEPGFTAVRVDPQLGDLEWARATVPTPHGFLTVEAHADGTVEIDSPVPVVD